MDTPDKDDALRARVREAVERTSAREVASRAGLSHETVYAVLRGAALAPKTRRALRAALPAEAPSALPSAAVSPDADRGPATPQPSPRPSPGPPDASGPTVEIPLAVLAYWRGMLESDARVMQGIVQTLGGVSATVSGISESIQSLQAMLERSTHGVTAFVDSGVLPDMGEMSARLRAQFAAASAAGPAAAAKAEERDRAASPPPPPPAGGAAPDQPRASPPPPA